MTKNQTYDFRIILHKKRAEVYNTSARENENESIKSNKFFSCYV